MSDSPPKKPRKPRPPIAGRIARLRHVRGLNQMDAAEAIGISRSHLASIETGTDLPGRETLQAIADFYRVTTDHILTGRLAGDGPATDPRREDVLSSFDATDERGREILHSVARSLKPPRLPK